MKMEADRMRNLVFSEQTFTDMVVQERLQRTENSPDRQLGERIDAALWVTHPYRDPVIGWMNEVSSLTRQDALDIVVVFTGKCHCHY